MTLPAQVSGSDLLKQVEGVESRLQRGRRVGLVAWAVFFVSLTAEIVLLIQSVHLDELKSQWPFVALAAVLAGSLLLGTATRYWIRESEEPFRYTFSVGPFQSVVPETDEELEWLPHDLLKKLAERIRRLFVLEEDEAAEPAEQSEDEAAGREASHIHIGGHYGKRLMGESPETRAWILEIVPQVRIGRGRGPATVARGVRVVLDGEGAEPGAPPALTPKESATLLERVYFSVATEIYRQIREDVQRKIDLLPTSYLRGTAYLREADDYARSNTLDAYAEAATLYANAIREYDRLERIRPSDRWRHRWDRLLRARARLAREVRRRGSRIWPRLARREVLAAKAEVGHANVLLTEFHLAGLSAVRARPAFSATRWSESAIRRLQPLSPDTPDREKTLFAAHVVDALAKAHVGDNEAATRIHLPRARSLRPARAEDHPMYLFAEGLTEPSLVRGMRLLRRAVEIDPDLDAARAYLAMRLEELWRSRERLEPSVARLVVAELKGVVGVNPGIVGAWGTLGYVNWLLAGTDDDEERRYYWEEARRAFEAGREYKAVRGETLTAEVDYGLARMAAEQGRFEDAYGHYISTVAAQLSDYGLDYSDYFFNRGGEALLDRFRCLRERVEAHMESAAGATRSGVEERVRKSVYAFILNDVGQAQVYYYRRSGSPEALDKAQARFSKACEQNPDFALPHYNLAQLYMWKVYADRTRPGAGNDLESARVSLETALRAEPEWPAARLLLAELDALQAQLLQQQIETAGTKLEAELTALTSKLAAQPGSAPGSRGSSLGDYPILRDSTAPGRSEDETEERDRRIQDLREQEYTLWLRRQGLLEHGAGELRRLLPQPCFREPAADGAHHGTTASLIDAEGTAIARVLEGAIDWESDLNGLHIDALIHWVLVLEASGTRTSLAAAERLATHIEQKYYPADFNVLATHRNVARELLARLSSDEGGDGAPDAERKRLDLVDETCTERIHFVVEHELERDPAHYSVLLWALELDESKKVEALKRALDAESATPPTLIWLGERFQHDLNDGTSAERAYKTAKEEADWRPHALARLGILLNERGDGVEAEKAFKEYRDAIDSLDIAVYPTAAVRLGDLLAAAGRGAEAEASYRRASESDDANVYPTAALRLGDLLAQSNRPEAEAAYRRAIDSGEPAAYPTAALRLGDLLAQSNRPEAEAAYRLAMGSEDLNIYPFAAVRLGDLLGSRGDQAESESAYRRGATSRNPYAAPLAAAKLGERLAESGHPGRARSVYEHVAGLGAYAAVALGDLLVEDDAASAEEAYRRGTEKKGDLYAPDAFLRLGEALARRGAKPQAEEKYRQAIRSRDITVYPTAALHLGELLAAEGRVSEAAEAYQEAIDSNDLSVAPPAAIRLGELLEAGGEAPRAQSVYRRLAESNASAAIALGDLLRERRPEAAESAYRLGTEREGDPHAPAAFLRLGELYAESGRETEAEDAYRVAINSNDVAVVPAAVANLGQLLEARGDAEEAKRLYRRIDALGASAAVALGDLLRERNPGAAESAYRRGTEHEDDSHVPVAFLHLGDLLAEQGRDAQAEAAYRRAAENGAAPDAASEARERLQRFET